MFVKIDGWGSSESTTLTVDSATKNTFKPAAGSSNFCGIGGTDSV